MRFDDEGFTFGLASAQNDWMTSTQESPGKLLSRRGLLAIGAGAALLPVMGGTAQARRRVGPAPETVALPDGFRPEGIASGPGTTYYAGSMANGSIVTGDLLTGGQSVLLPASPGRAIRGLFFDDRSGILWFVGNVSTVQWVWAVDTSDGSVVFGQAVEGAGFHNDVVVTDSYVYVTDSRVDRLVRVPLDPITGAPVGTVSFVPLGGVWPASPPSTTNANGIRELSDGSLVLNNSRVGGLWQVNPATGVATPIPVKGGPGLVGGDGLEIDGDVLYNVRGSGPNQVAVVLLRQSATGWTAKWAGARTDETLDVPSTAALAGGWLWVINARFGNPSPLTIPYWIPRIPAR
jgi:hypothetical protein